MDILFELDESAKRQLAAAPNMIPHCLEYLAAREIEKLREALRHAAAELDEASVDIGDWGAYADEYTRKKFDLRGDVKYYERAASRARKSVTPNAKVS